MTNTAQTINHLMLRGLLLDLYLNPLNTVVLKISQSYALYTNIVDWLRLFIMLAMADNSIYWVELIGINVVQSLLIIFWHYVKLNERPDLQYGFMTVSSFFCYRFLNQIFTNLALFRLLFIYLPNLPPVSAIPELEKEGAFLDAIKFALNLNKKVSFNEFEWSNEVRMDIEKQTDNMKEICRNNFFCFFSKNNIDTTECNVLPAVVNELIV